MRKTKSKSKKPVISHSKSAGPFSRESEKERFKKSFSSELLEYHFEKWLGKNEHNGVSWRRLLEDNVQPHTDMLCDLSRWLLAQGWSEKVVEELFFVVEEKDS